MDMPEELRTSVSECDRRLQALEAALEPLLSAQADAQVRTTQRCCRRHPVRVQLTFSCAHLAQLEPLERAQMQLTLAHAATVVFTSASWRRP
jgi:hypothetical protein